MSCTNAGGKKNCPSVATASAPSSATVHVGGVTAPAVMTDSQPVSCTSALMEMPGVPCAVVARSPTSSLPGQIVPGVVPALSPTSCFVRSIDSPTLPAYAFALYPCRLRETLLLPVPPSCASTAVRAGGEYETAGCTASTALRAGGLYATGYCPGVNCEWIMSLNTVPPAGSMKTIW